MVPAAGLPLVTLAVRGVDSSRPLSAALALARLLPAVMAARRILRDFAADVVVGAAGYVCVPVVLAARSLRIPVVLMEQNAVPGRAVRLLAGGARAVAASFAETAERLPRTRVVHGCSRCTCRSAGSTRGTRCSTRCGAGWPRPARRW